MKVRKNNLILVKYLTPIWIISWKSQALPLSFGRKTRRGVTSEEWVKVLRAWHVFIHAWAPLTILHIPSAEVLITSPDLFIYRGFANQLFNTIKAITRAQYHQYNIKFFNFFLLSLYPLATYVSPSVASKTCFMSAS